MRFELCDYAFALLFMAACREASAVTWERKSQIEIRNSQILP